MSALIAATQRLILSVPSTARSRQAIHPELADPWRQTDEAGTWHYRFSLTTPADLDAALQVLFTWGWKWERILIHGAGIPLQPAAVRNVLVCLKKSYAQADYRAHCWTGQKAVPLEQEPARIRYTLTGSSITKDVADRHGRPLPDPSKAPVWLHPCRLASGWQQLTTYHPSGIRAQIDAALVDHGCRWCPRLDNLEAWETKMWGTQTEAPFGPILLDDGRV